MGRLVKRLVKHYKITFFFLFLGAVSWSYYPREFVYTGSTMGTQFTIKAYKRFYVPKRRIIDDVNRTLIRLSAQFSTYSDASQISEFNQQSVLLELSNDWRALLSLSQKLHDASSGAWDPTVWPLTKLWNLNRQDVFVPPSDAVIQDQLAITGFDKITFDGKVLSKKNAKTQLDLSSIAKGYAVDRLSDALLDMGITQFYVEIGGEIRVGKPLQGQPFWRLGIQDPQNTTSGAIVEVVELSTMSLATSGTYRQFRTWKGQAFSHILDPRTGYPIDNNVISVSVIHPSCAVADGLATALMVLNASERQSLMTAFPKARIILFESGPNGLQKIKLP